MLVCWLLVACLQALAAGCRLSVACCWLMDVVCCLAAAVCKATNDEMVALDALASLPLKNVKWTMMLYKLCDRQIQIPSVHFATANQRAMPLVSRPEKQLWPKRAGGGARGVLGGGDRRGGRGGRRGGGAARGRGGRAAAALDAADGDEVGDARGREEEGAESEAGSVSLGASDSGLGDEGAEAVEEASVASDSASWSAFFKDVEDSRISKTAHTYESNVAPRLRALHIH